MKTNLTSKLRVRKPREADFISKLLSTAKVAFSQLQNEYE